MELFKALNLLPVSGYGEITFMFQAGKIVFVKRNETRQKFDDE